MREIPPSIYTKNINRIEIPYRDEKRPEYCKRMYACSNFVSMLVDEMSDESKRKNELMIRWWIMQQNYRVLEAMKEG